MDQNSFYETSFKNLDDPLFETAKKIDLSNEMNNKKTEKKPDGKFIQFIENYLSYLNKAKNHENLKENSEENSDYDEEINFLKGLLIKYDQKLKKYRFETKLQNKEIIRLRKRENFLESKCQEKNQIIEKLEKKNNFLKSHLNNAKSIIIKEKYEKEKKKKTINKLINAIKSDRQPRNNSVCIPNQKNENDIRKKSEDRKHYSQENIKNKELFNSTDNENIYYTPKLKGNSIQEKCDKFHKSLQAIKDNQALMEKISLLNKCC